MATVNPSKHTSSKPSRKHSAHKVHTLPLATTAALLTAATCLGSQPAMAVTADAITTPTQAATANKKLADSTGAKHQDKHQDREADVVVNNPEWLKTPSILEFQRYRSTNDERKDKKALNSDDYGSDEHNTLIKKTDMYAHIETIDGAKYLVFDVFFNNDAQSMVNLSKRQWYIWQVPYQIAKLNPDGSFASDTIRDLRFDAYKLKDASQNDKLKRKMNFTLSRDFAKFEKVDNQSTTINFPNDHEKNFGGNRKNSSSFHYGLGPNQTKYERDMSDLFHENRDDYAIGKATWLDYPYSGKNYGIGIQTSEVNLAFHMHAAVKLNDTAINEKATTYDEKYANIHNAWTWADSATYGRTTSSSYAWVSGRDPESDQDKNLKRHKDDSEAPKIYYNGKEITDNQTIQLNTGDKLSFTTTDDKGYIEKFSISGLTDTPTTKQGAGSEDKPLSSGDITVTKKMKDKEVTITSEDGSGNVTTRKVKVTATTKPKLSKEHPLTGKTIDITVGDKLPPLAKIDNFVTVKDGKNLETQPTLSWKDTVPDTNTVGTFTHEITGTYSDNSTSKATVTINVKPNKPIIDTDLTDLAGKKGQKVTVSVGDGIPTDATTTVKLFDKNGKEIGSTTTIKDGKAEITVNDGIPEGDVYATTTVKKPDKKDGPKKTIPGFELTSENSDKKQATAPKDNEKPTITAIAESSSVTVGQDLKIHIVAKDDVKVKEINYIQALTSANLLQTADILRGRASVSKTKDSDQEQVLDLTVKNMQPKEVGTHTITFTVTDSAGKTGTVTLTITVKPAAPTVTTPTSGKDQGSATITPADGTDTLEITYTPEGENTNPTNFTVKKENGKWKGDNIPEGVKVDENTGKVTIPANKVKDGSSVTAIDKKGDTSSDKATGNVGKNPAKPTVSDPKAENKTGKDKTTVSGKATPGAKVTIKKDGQKVGEVTAQDDGTFTVDIDKQDPNTKLTLTPSKDGADGDPVETTVTGETPAAKPTAPKVEPQDDGSVNVTPADGTDTLEITYTPEGEDKEKTITVKKDNDGNWTGTTPDGVTVDKTTGKVTIPANKVKDGSDVKAKDKKGNDTSDETTGKAGNAGNVSTGTSGFNASAESGNMVSGKHFSQLAKTGDEFEQAGLISAMVGLLGAATAFFSRKKNRDQKARPQK